MHKIAISVDDLGAEWLSLTGLCNLPFVELKVDRKFVTGCAEDRRKQSICRRILDLADRLWSAYHRRGGRDLGGFPRRTGDGASIWYRAFCPPNR
jgi:hypothetical protein